MQLHLVLLTNCVNDQKAGVNYYLHHLLPFLQTQADLRLTIIETDHPAINHVTYRQDGNTTIISIPCPENKFTQTAIHSLQQMIYARRLADILYNYLHTQTRLIFWANSIDYIWLFEALKAHHQHARLLYVHHEWSWKQYLNLPDAVFSEYWTRGDITSCPRAFELTAYEQKMALLADRVVTVSNQAAAFFTSVLHIPSDKIKTIKNGAAFPDESESISAVRSHYGLSDDEKIILYIGDISCNGGVYVLVNAFKQVLQKYRNSRLLIVGEGDYSTLLSQANPLWGRLTFTGPLTPAKLNQLILSADMGIVPALYGQCSFAAIHMCYRKLPLIISDVDGLAEVYHDGVTALKINIARNENHEPEINSGQLKEKILSLIKNENLAKMLSINAYNMALDQFDLTKMGRTYLQLFHEIA
jgi:glycosyltransferase involved in cell wall biosynthesis